MKALLLATSLLFVIGCFDNNSIKKDKKNQEDTSTLSYTPKQLELKSYLDLYFVHLQNLDTDNIILMTYPKLFIPINKTVFQQYINTLLTSQHISVESFTTKVLFMSPVESYSDGEFAQIRYVTTIKLNFINPKLYSDELSVRVLNDVLSRKYGKENIDINPVDRTITIVKEEKLLALKDNGRGWKFLGDNPSYRELYPRILPADLLTKI